EDAAQEPAGARRGIAGGRLRTGPDSRESVAERGNAGRRSVPDGGGRAGTAVPGGGDPIRLAGDADFGPRPVVRLAHLSAGAADDADLRPPEAADVSLHQRH